MSDEKRAKPPAPRTHVPRPDELSPEAFEFIAAVDEFKRSHMVSMVNLTDVVGILDSLGYVKDQVDQQAVEELTDAVDAYKQRTERLFPNWSEIYKVVIELGYVRRD